MVTARPLTLLVGFALILSSCQVEQQHDHDSVARHVATIRTQRESTTPITQPGTPQPATADSANDFLNESTLPLNVAREIALRDNPDIHAAQARLLAAAAKLDEAFSRYSPSILITHNATRTFHTPASRNRLGTLLQPSPTVPADVDPNTFAITTLINALRRPLFGGGAGGNRNSFSEHSTAFTGTWTLFDGFIRDAQVAAAKYLRHAADLSLQDVRRRIIDAVNSAYYQVQLAEERLRIAQADEAFGKEQLQETEKLRTAGRATSADVDNFRVRVLAAKADVTAAIGFRDTGRIVLAELMGVGDVVLPSDLALAPLEDESAADLAAPQPETWVDEALRNRPDLRQFRELLGSERENVRAVRGLYLPSVGVSASWGFDRSSDFNYDVDDQSSAAGMEFRWEVYTGGSRRARVLQAQSLQTEAEANLHRLRLAVVAETRTAVIQVFEAQLQITLQRERLTTAAEHRRIVQAGYVAGKEPLTRLNEAQRDYVGADANLVLSRIRLRQAWSDLHIAAARVNLPAQPPESHARSTDEGH